MITVELPIKTVSEVNKRCHWAVKAARVKAQRSTVFMALRCKLPACFTLERATVTLIRIAPRELDDDNLRSALKAVRDGVADALGINDRDKRVEWIYTQEKHNPKEYGIKVAIIDKLKP
jgi:hypothetical protein